jgi:hypothetical protein
MNWKECGRKRSWPNLRHYHCICLEELRKVSKDLSQDSRFPVQDFNPGLPEYETGVLTTRARHSLLSYVPARGLAIARINGETGIAWSYFIDIGK